MIRLVQNSKHIVIIGGGITGLTAAFYLKQAIQEKNLPITFTLLEASDRLGGKIQTVRKEGYVIERGPDSFLERKVSASKLVKAVGLGDELVRNNTGQAYILRGRKLFPMPEGAVMGIPTKLSPFIKTGLISPWGKLRAAQDLLLPRSGIDGDQSLGEFFERRLGREVVNRLIEPLLSGIYAGDLDKLSLMSTFPQFYETEKKHRSLMLGMKKTTPKKSAKPQKKQGAFLTVKGGLESLVAKLEEEIGPDKIKKGTPVTSIDKLGESYQINLRSSDMIAADSVLLAIPHNKTVDLLKQYDLFRGFDEMPATSVATVAMAFPEDQVSIDYEGTGFVIARDSDYTITACTWTHKKWSHTVPKGKVLLRCYVGRPDDQEIVFKDDEEILKIVIKDLQKIININGNPDFHVITRWKNAMPQYLVGYQDRLKLFKGRVAIETPGVFVAGASYGGVGLPDCMKSGEEAVSDVLGFLSK